MKLYTIVGYENGMGNRVFETYTDLKVARACLDVHKEYIKEAEIVENEVNNIDGKIYKLTGFDGWSYDFLNISNTLEGAKALMYANSNELKEFGMKYESYDIEEIEI